MSADETLLPSEAVKTWPDRIYLQTTNPDSPACETLYRNGPYDHESITWCIDRIDKGDVEYIRADLVRAEQPKDPASDESFAIKAILSSGEKGDLYLTVEREDGSSVKVRFVRRSFRRICREFRAADNDPEQSKCPTQNCDHDLRLPTGGVHVLKTEETAWDAMERGEKTAEFRLNDRDYHVGDQLILKRGTDDKPHLTLHRIVTHALYGPAFGVPEGYVMLSCGPCDCPTHRTGQAQGPVTAKEAEAGAYYEEESYVRLAPLSSLIIQWRARAKRLLEQQPYPGFAGEAEQLDRLASELEHTVNG